MSETMIHDIRPDFDQPNYDPNRIAPFVLEDPLCFCNGSPVRTASDWSRRRQEIVDLFARRMYGALPPVPETLEIKCMEETSCVLGGYAVRSQYRMTFRPDHSGPAIHWLLLRPAHVKKSCPVIVFLNYFGNEELIPDEAVIPNQGWIGLVKDYKSTRGIMSDPNQPTVFPIGMLLAAGYAVMSACYCEVSPDPAYDDMTAPSAYQGVFDLWGKRDESKEDNPTALGVWAWALSRGLDLAERIPALDVSRSVVTGCSRLGKAALLAASRDERFSVCAAIQCGGGGATLAKRDFGENIATEVRMFPHWYCKKYGDYARNPAQLLDFDQHLLLASIAPRKLLIGGFDEPWFDTQGEFLACLAASPVWRFLGKTGMPCDQFPADYDTSCIGSDLGYYRRTEKHGIAAFDWLQILRFAGMG